MRCLQHVLWRGAMALSLVLAGVASSYGLPDEPLRSGQSIAVCPEGAVASTTDLRVKRIEYPDGRTRIVVQRG